MNSHSPLVLMLHFYSHTLPDHRGKWWLHYRLRRIFRVHVDEECDVVRGDLHWRLNPADFVQADVYWDGCKDRYDLYHLKRILKPGQVFFDVGSNFGYYSVVLASHLNKKCVVHAFEPNPPTFEKLRHHIQINGLEGVVHAHDLAMSDCPGSASLSIKGHNSGGSHVVPTVTGSTRIRLTTLDDFCDEQRLARLDVIKIDVEGFEEKVLRGGMKTLQRWRPVLLLELEPARLHDKQTSADRVMRLLDELGYELYVSSREKLVPLTRVPQGSERPNVFCIPRQKDERSD